MRSVKSSAKSRIGLLSGSTAACAFTRLRIEMSVTVSIARGALMPFATDWLSALAIGTSLVLRGSASSEAGNLRRRKASGEIYHLTKYGAWPPRAPIDYVVAVGDSVHCTAMLAENEKPV